LGCKFDEAIVYTLDIENLLKIKKRNNWYQKWLDIDVYYDEIIIYVPNDFSNEDRKLSSEKLSDIFNSYLIEESKIKLDYYDRILNINYEKSENSFRKKSIPLFKELGGDEFQSAPLAGVPIIAFHSYKGGVGRTLSLLATARALSITKKANGENFRLLIVDGDVEAPGLTWLAKDISALSSISFLDSLAIIHEEDDWHNRALPFIVKKVKETMLKLPVGDQEIEHYFLPSFSGMEDDNNFLFPISITPEDMVYINNREWIVSNFLSELGQLLNVDVVLLDLRAGITELAAPILFDKRVRKIYVTSSSLQSRKGTKELLKRIYEKPIEDIYPNPMVFVTMVTEEFSELVQEIIAKEFMEIFNEWVPQIEPEQLFDTFFKILPFASNLVYLEGFNTINRKLSGTEMAKNISSIVSEWFIDEKDVRPKEIKKNKRDKFLDGLIDLTTKMEFAEANNIGSFLSTAPLKSFSRKYSNSLPISIILGAKGSGKTFIYFQLIRSGTWENFVTKIDKEISIETSSNIIPFLAPKNLNSDSAVLEEVRNHLNSINELLGFDIKIQELINRGDTIEVNQSDSELEWKNFWKRTLLESLGSDFTNFDQLQQYLERENKRVVFVIDGLEEIFQNVSASVREKIAIRSLCQGIINEFRAFMNNRIGLIIFLRQDVAKNAIVQNWGQFYAQYESFELKWTHTEALRLTLWLANLIDKEIKIEKIPIETATREIIERTLYLLWGRKLGRADSKEAYTANWILAALSDLNEQLQARDIVRFLKFAAQGSKILTINDRYLVPIAIRNAIEPCSKSKITEIKQEISSLKEVFDKFELKPYSERQVPFQLEEFNLTIEEATMLEQQGFLIKLDDGYYMPEIIRRGLNFSLQRGARPKVFALLKKALKRGKEDNFN
jgi:MinD-like ATPase involved in chromosome partitioning or flagellar assembly